jgi:hypothetical protein
MVRILEGNPFACCLCLCALLDGELSIVQLDGHAGALNKAGILPVRLNSIDR